MFCLVLVLVLIVGLAGSLALGTGACFACREGGRDDIEPEIVFGRHTRGKRNDSLVLSLFRRRSVLGLLLRSPLFF